MTRYTYEPLTALDDSFLLHERPNAFMHVASVAVLDAGPLAAPTGGVDIGRIRRGIAAVLHRLPRYRQKLDRIPITGAPIWIDDDEFSLDYHVRHTSLPRPGDREQLKRLAARIMAGHLDRSRPLWECWVVEGLEGGQFAVINKTHHAMIDGSAGIDLMNVLMTPSPEVREAEVPAFIPRRPPTASELAWDELRRRARLPFDAVRDLGELWRAARNTRRGILNRARQIAEIAGASLRSASATPLNQRIGPHRRFDWTTHEVDALKAVRQELGGTLNDIVLTIVTGAVRRFLSYRRVDPATIDFRVLAPVSVEEDGPAGPRGIGHRVSAWFVPLPIDEPDAASQRAAISETTRELETRKPAVAAGQLMNAGEWNPGTLLSLGARNATRLTPYNIEVTNVPGPQVPIHLLGARMTEIYPLVPLVEGVGLGIALFSYAGRLHWGVNADYELVPDLDRFIGFLDDAFDDLRKAAHAKRRLRAGKTPSRKRARKAQSAAEA